ncbi:MAG: hypothetical protein AAGA37_13800 [Actinomycetota bacterium]
MTAGEPAHAPTEEDLVRDLKELRRAGIVELSNLAVPALRQVVRAAGRVEDSDAVRSYAIEAMLRDAVGAVGGDAGDFAATLLGLGEAGRSATPAELRKAAIAEAKINATTFRQSREPRYFRLVAQELLLEAHRYRLRVASLRRDARTPIGSRLAVEWLHRFEAMYQVWTPVTGVGNDLTAYRSVMLEEDRPWDRPPNPDIPGDTGDTQEEHAQMYVTWAMYFFARVLSSTRRFIQNHGGMWLLPDAQAETDLGDANYRIRMASPNTEEEDSQLRLLLRRCEDEELVPFLELLQTDPAGIALHNKWQAWVATCTCTWDEEHRGGNEFFPTHRNHPGIDPQCDMHILITACADFAIILDDAWDQMADWYTDLPTSRQDITGEQLYAARENRLPKYLMPEPDPATDPQPGNAHNH